MIIERVNNNGSITYGVISLSKFYKLCRAEATERYARSCYHMGRSTLLQLEDSTIFVDGKLVKAEGLSVRYTFFR